MKQKIIDYAKRIYDLKIQRSVVLQTDDIIKDVPEILTRLEDPMSTLEEKHQIIELIFPEEIRDFLKVLCSNNEISDAHDIFLQYNELQPEDTKDFQVVLSYVTPPTDEQRAALRQFIKRKFGRDDYKADLVEEPDLGSGFVLKVGDIEYDWSAKGRLEQFKEKLAQSASKSTLSQSGILSILQEGVDVFNMEVRGREIGTVMYVGDGIVHVDGIDHAMYGEIVVFDNGVKGMVQDICPDHIGCVLFGRDTKIREGTHVTRTGKQAGIAVGDEYLGRVVDALGAPIDGLDPINSSEYLPIENEAPGIIDRKSVSVPLETGILSIDSMFPIGRGQRELIIGDRQTGKTSIATDTILNQKGKDVVCIYVAIGQKASTVAKLVNTFRKGGAMDYTIVLSASASDPAPLQYIAPYAGTSLAEYFMNQGKDVLIVYDDLSKHAVAYRALSLLLERSPGREAYPGDVFYLHSRLLERSSRLSDARGGGSITALPIIETQAGDVSAYIPTNVISITDGQIFLESDLFFAGMRPAVNVGLSVSRVGGAAQAKAMKKAAGSIRIDLAQYREMEVFTQFSSDLDDVTKEQLAYGKGLMELLKQPLGHPFSLHEQVITLVAATNKVMIKVPVEQIKKFQTDMLAYFEQSCPEIIREIENSRMLSEELTKQIVDSANKFAENYQVVK